MQNSTCKIEYGFTLIELMMAMTLFGVVTVVSTAALLSVVDASRKAQAIQSVMGNLNTALDGMVRSVTPYAHYAPYHRVYAVWGRSNKRIANLGV
jgi:prepilin-type N-terminal cleavage/methylation domain-containing protein